MRLLNIRTRTLEEFFDADIPRYAILSHTWGPNEPTYRDFATPGVRDANVKIDGCCEQALVDGYEYVWIDTICIDKSSSAELSEAINSMFTWYENADVCYAYLSDVSSGYYDTPVAQLAGPETDFHRSRWFTRGWTLQELIAPKRVVFYNFRWLKIMEKRIYRGHVWREEREGHDNWHDVLKRITGIPCEILDGSADLADISVAARMTWAAHRQTTRKEDIAYCLLGIFKINMSMLYGEGVRAFTRLQEEIIRTSDDESIFAWGFWNFNAHLVQDSDGITPRSLLASSPTDFLGCDNIQIFAAEHFYGSRNPMSTHYSMTNKGLLVDRPLLVLPPPFHTVLVPLNCCPGVLGKSPWQILALPLRNGQANWEAYDEAQLFVDSSCTPILMDTNLIKGEPVKKKTYISTKPLRLTTALDWRNHDKRIQVNIQDASSGMSAKAVLSTWFTPPSMWRRDTTSGVFLLSKACAPLARGSSRLTKDEPPTHALVDLKFLNGQRYMVHLVQPYASEAPNSLSFTAGVCRQDPAGTAVEDIIRMDQEGYFARQVSQTLWPTTSDDGAVRLELSAPDRSSIFFDFIASYNCWKLKIHVS